MELAVLKYVAAGIGAGLTVIGAAIGLGKIGNAALEGPRGHPRRRRVCRRVNRRTRYPNPCRAALEHRADGATWYSDGRRS